MTTSCAELRHASWAGVRRHVREDILRDLRIRFQSEDGTAVESARHMASSFLVPGVLSVFLYRVAHYLHLNGWRRAAKAIAAGNQILHKVHITPQSCIGPGAFIPHPAGVTFHGTAGSDLTLYSLACCCPMEGEVGAAAVTGPSLGDRVAVGRAMILGPVAIGDDAHIFATRVVETVPARSVVLSRIVRVRMRAAGESS